MRETKTKHPWKTLDCHPLVHVVLKNDAVTSSFHMRLGDGLMLTQDNVGLIGCRFIKTREETAAKCPDGIQLYYSIADVDLYNARCLNAEYNVLYHPTCVNITGYKNKQAHRDALTKMANMNASDMGSLPA